MIIYKFGGASVQSAHGIRNIATILTTVNGDEKLVIVISAMGKVTNALERLLAALLVHNVEVVELEMSLLKKYHYSICDELNIVDRVPVEGVFSMLEVISNNLDVHNYDRAYDRLVSFGEMLSTTIISQYLNMHGMRNTLIDMRECCITDNYFREANVDFVNTKCKLEAVVNSSSNNVFIAQGFIGGTLSGEPTTLGREGSDYTAAVLANVFDAQSVTIWKDVPGILNGDPRIFKDATLIEKLSYVDAVELAYSGAQIIHPKTIRPLENKKIPLYVKPFLSPQSNGSVICETDLKIELPIYIVKSNQILVSIHPKDFSFILEESLPHIFTLLNDNRQKVRMVQSSAVKVYVSVDESPYFENLILSLKQKYDVVYTQNLELVTIRGNFTQLDIDKVKGGRKVLVKQRTSRSYKLLYHNSEI